LQIVYKIQETESNSISTASIIDRRSLICRKIGKNSRGGIKRLRIQLTDGDTVEPDISHDKNESDIRKMMPFPCCKISHFFKRRQREKEPIYYQKFCALIYEEVT
jgi:hypothetical protein